jgi:endonuclease YncB( thermonuclease family)
MRLALPGLLASLLIALVAAPTAGAAKVPCVVGDSSSPKCKAWEAKAHNVEDGDTFSPKIKLGKKWSPPKSVRLTGIQAMELTGYSRTKGRKGACMGVEATEAFEALIKHSKIRLVAQKGGSVTEGNRTRLRRSVQVQRGGKWIDPAQVLLEKGLVLWFPNSQEWAWNGAYSRAAETAAAKGLGLWNPEACGKPGPSATSPLSIKAKWDGPNKDTANGEFIRITNHDPLNAVPIGGWNVRDSHLRGDKLRPGYIFPSGAVIPAGGSVMVRMGNGRNSAGEFFWGLGETIFEQASEDKFQTGDGAYLFDPDGEMRAHVQYPCRTSCADPLDGVLDVEARYQGVEHEWVTITNTSASPISLNQYELESPPWFFEFGPRDILLPGRSFVVWIDKPHRVPLTNGSRILVPAVAGVPPFQGAQGFKSWNFSDPLLSDNGDAVLMRNPAGAPVQGGCANWGRVSCPTYR